MRYFLRFNLLNFVILSLSFTFLGASHAFNLPSNSKINLDLAVIEHPPLIPMFYVYSAERDDYFYSANVAQIDEAVMNQGYDDLPVPQGIGLLGYIEERQQTNTVPLLRFKKHAFGFYHFYSADIDEIEFAIANGYRHDGIEGYVYNVQVPGTQALFRLSKLNFSTGDRVQVFATSALEIEAFEERGFLLDGTIGFINVKVTNNGAPLAEDGLIIGRRCQTDAYFCGGDTYRNFYFNQGVNLNSNYKPGSELVYHQLKFSILTWDAFSPEIGHFALMLRNRVQYDPNNILVTRFDGVGIIIGGFNCAGNTKNNRVTVEIWRPDTGTNGMNYVDCEFLSPELSNGVKYDFEVRSYNDGVLFYSIREHESQIAIFEKKKNVKYLYENMGGVYRPFPMPVANSFYDTKNMNYSIFHAGDSRHDFTIFLEGVSAIWSAGFTPK